MKHILYYLIFIVLVIAFCELTGITDPSPRQTIEDLEEIIDEYESWAENRQDELLSALEELRYMIGDIVNESYMSYHYYEGDYESFIEDAEAFHRDIQRNSSEIYDLMDDIEHAARSEPYY